MRKHILTFFILPLVCIAADMNIETITQNDGEKTPVARHMTVSNEGKVVYRLFEALDPSLKGSKMPLYKETLIVDDHAILTVKWFPEAPEYEFVSYQDFIVQVKQGSPRRILATSNERNLKYEWKEDDKGFLAIFTTSTLK